MPGNTLFSKIWDAHVVASYGEGDLLHVDRHFLHDLGGAPALAELEQRGLPVMRPDLTVAMADHTVATAQGRASTIPDILLRLVDGLRDRAARHGIRYFEVDTAGHGIVHVMGPELGISLPGTLIVCSDSHTCTHGGLGAMGFGIGSSEVVHVLATQCVVQRKPPQMRIVLHGALHEGVTAKDVALHIVGLLGAAGGTGFAVEYSGEAVAAMSIEARMTLCNLSVEFGAKIGLTAPDQKTIDFVRITPYRPTGAGWAQALAAWSRLVSDADAVFDREIEIDVSSLAPQITWGTSPQDVVGVDGRVPDPAAEPDPARSAAMWQSMRYMGLDPAQPLLGIPVDRVFIGSCTNGRLSDLRAAAALARGKRVAPTVSAWVVAGSDRVKRAAEAEGLDRIFLDAGFEWREPGCSMCLAANGEVALPGERVVSTSNRNFVGRQGRGARTHLASPLTATACALAGVITFA